MSDTNPQGQGPVVQNPALGNLAPQIQLPAQQQQQPQQFQQAPQQQQPWQQAPVQPHNPYVIQPQVANPYGPVQNPGNPYGPPAQQSPYAAPPQGQSQFLQPGQVPFGQAAPAPQPQPQQQPQPQNPAYQFNPYAQQQPQQQQPQVPGNPFAQLPAQQSPQAQQPAQLTAQQLAQQPGGITDAQVQEIFPDQTSQAIFQGMSAISKGQGIDLLAAFGSAYERRDPSLVNERYLAQFDPATTAMLKGQFQALVQQGQQRDAAAEQQVYQMAGGKENWGRAVQAFNASADKQTIDAVAAAVNSGDPNQVHLAVQHILRSAQQGGNMIQRSGQLLTPNGGGQNGQQVMTNDAFRQHLAMLEQAHPVGSPQYNQHYQQLVKQRAAAKAQGY